MEGILSEVAELGWTEARREEFVRRYDRFIGRAVIYFLARYRNLSGQEIHRLLESVERRLKGRSRVHETGLLDLVEEVYLRVYEQVFRTRLLQDYVDGYHRGRIACEFPAYLRGVIRNRVVDCLRVGKAKMQEVSIEEWEEQITEGSPDWAKALRAEWWDRLVRCREAGSKELEDLEKVALALREEAARRTGLCLACARIKMEGSESLREDMRMFLVYYLSNYGTGEAAAGRRRLPSPEELSLERIRGLRLSWAEIFEIFGRECNPTRVRAKIREKFEELAYGREVL